MKKTFLYVSVVVAAVLNFSCQGEKHAPVLELPSTDPGTPTVVTEVEGVPNGSPLYFKLGIAWESDTSGKFADVKACSIPPGAVGVNTDITCSISVPELKLFYSKLNFKVGTLDAVSCPYVYFHPYYYRRAKVLIHNSWEDSGVTHDCASKPRDNTCYGGAAPAILGEDWKTNDGRYFHASVGNEANFPLDSANSIRQLGYFSVNYMVTNDITDPNDGRETPQPPPAQPTDPPVPAEVGAYEKVQYHVTDTEPLWQDYEMACRDIWGAELYKITLKISDENTESNNGGAVDHYPDWPY